MKKTKQHPLVLAGDIGGTKTRLGLFKVSRTGIEPVKQRIYQSGEYAGLEDIVVDFYDQREGLAAAVFGVAGPVLSGTARATNLSWKISEKSLKKLLALDRVALTNDLVANAYGIEVMGKNDFATLNKGRELPGNRALLSAGTGLGAAILFWDGKKHVPSPSEGGHVDFAPTNRLELGLLRYLFEEHERVSYERVLSGSGLYNIYRFLRDTGAYGPEPRRLAERLEKEDRGAVIAESAQRGKSRLCAAALEMFVSIYGAAAGNLAFQAMATGGIYIGGGIAPKIIMKMKQGAFIKAFTAKGRLSPIVKQIPVRVIMNDQAALLGAAFYAARLMSPLDQDASQAAARS